MRRFQSLEVYKHADSLDLGQLEGKEVILRNGEVVKSDITSAQTSVTQCTSKVSTTIQKLKERASFVGIRGTERVVMENGLGMW